MGEPAYRIEPLAKHHDRAGFDCGNEELNRFLRQTAGQWAKKDVAQTHVIVATTNPPRIVGYYSLNATKLEPTRLGSTKGLPHSMEIGAILLGKLAVDRSYHRRGIGTMLLVDAFERVLAFRGHVGIFAIIVDAIDDGAVGYYVNFGFTPFMDDPYRLYYPLKDYEKTRAGTEG